jgi:Tetracyclin repressor-like, C-terminal domain
VTPPPPGLTALRTTFTTIIADGKKTGELPASLDDEEFIDALIGPLFFRHLIRKVPTDRDWIRRHIEHTLAAFAASPAAP